MGYAFPAPPVEPGELSLLQAEEAGALPPLWSPVGCQGRP